jgi:hypothetical protein
MVQTWEFMYELSGDSRTSYSPLEAYQPDMRGRRPKDNEMALFRKLVQEALQGPNPDFLSQTADYKTRIRLKRRTRTSYTSGLTKFIKMGLGWRRGDGCIPTMMVTVDTEITDPETLNDIFMAPFTSTWNWVNWNRPKYEGEFALEYARKESTASFDEDDDMWITDWVPSGNDNKKATN